MTRAAETSKRWETRYCYRITIAHPPALGASRLDATYEVRVRTIEQVHQRIAQAQSLGHTVVRIDKRAEGSGAWEPVLRHMAGPFGGSHR